MEDIKEGYAYWEKGDNAWLGFFEYPGNLFSITTEFQKMKN